MGEICAKTGTRRRIDNSERTRPEGHRRLVVTSLKTGRMQAPGRPVQRSTSACIRLLTIFTHNPGAGLILKMTLGARARGLAFGRTRHPTAG